MLMSRYQAIQHLVRSARRLTAGETCNIVPQRLLSNSQASTSAATDGPDRDLRSSASRTQQSRQLPSQQPSKDSKGRADSRSLFDAPTDMSVSTDKPSAFGSTKSGSVQEAEPGFVADGPYPYPASDVEMTNLAGSTETAWDIIGAVDEHLITWFGMDFTRGTLPEVERNALLSNEAKEMMYQMHKHDNNRYSVLELASTFKIRQQRVMAILALKGMEHGDIPINPGKKPSTKASPTPAPTEAATEPSDDSPAQDEQPDPESGRELDLRAQAVKAAMREAATGVPRYLNSITKQSEAWQVKTTAGTPEEQATDSSILTAWIKSLVKDPFWQRPVSNEEDDKPVPDISEMNESQDLQNLTKADQEMEQQFLQDYHQAQQWNRTPAEGQEQPDTPQSEGYQRYLLSHPDNLHHIMAHDVWDCHEATGTGERHTKFIPRYPKFDYLKDDSPETLAAEQEAAASGHAQIDRPVISLWEEANLLQAEQEEKHLVHEFRERLRYNLQQDGAKLDRRSRSKHLPSRPAAGWSMVVQDVSQQGAKKQYVAMPDGSTRGLNDDEMVYLERKKPKRRRHIV